MLSKKIATTMTLALMVGSLAVVSAADNSTINGTTPKSLRSRGAITNTMAPDMQNKMAEKFGIGFPMFSMKDNFEAMAERFGIDTTDMTEDEIKAAIEANRKANLEAFEAMAPAERILHQLQQMAKRFDIDTTDMTAEDMKKALEAEGVTIEFSEDGKGITMGHKRMMTAEDYAEMAERLGIDIADMTEEEIKEAVEARLQDQQGEKGTTERFGFGPSFDIDGDSEGAFTMMGRFGRMKGGLEFNIDSSMTDEEIELQMLQHMARKCGIDTTDMTTEEMKAALEAKGIKFSIRTGTNAHGSNGMGMMPGNGPIDSEQMPETRGGIQTPQSSIPGTNRTTVKPLGNQKV